MSEEKKGYQKLGNRLKTIANLVSIGSIVADIGTDHGYLAVYLANKNISKKVYACDIAKKPLAQAEKTIKRYLASEKVKTLVSDGLDKIDNDELARKIDTVIIAGMGGELIGEIIFRANLLRDDSVTIISQPMNRIEIFRKNLYLNGFCIKEEKLAIEKDIIYTIMVIKYCKEKKELTLFEQYIGKILCSDNKYAGIYFENITRSIENKIYGMKQSKIIDEKTCNEVAENEKLLNDIKKILLEKGV